jgi:hypothetical protein
MVGEQYWATGVNMRHFDGKWAATVEFFDNGFCDDASTQGALRTRYFVPLETAIDTIIADAAKLGIEFRERNLYAEEDGESKDWPMPEDWREVLEAQAKRIGFKWPYLDTQAARP